MLTNRVGFACRLQTTRTLDTQHRGRPVKTATRQAGVKQLVTNISPEKKKLHLLYPHQHFTPVRVNVHVRV